MTGGLLAKATGVLDLQRLMAPTGWERIALAPADIGLVFRLVHALPMALVVRAMSMGLPTQAGGTDVQLGLSGTCGMNHEVPPTALIATSAASPSPTWDAITGAARQLGDFALALLLVVVLPLVFVPGAPLVFLAWVAVVTVQRFNSPRA